MRRIMFLSVSVLLFYFVSTSAALTLTNGDLSSRFTDQTAVNDLNGNGPEEVMFDQFVAVGNTGNGYYRFGWSNAGDPKYQAIVHEQAGADPDGRTRGFYYAFDDNKETTGEVEFSFTFVNETTVPVDVKNIFVGVGWVGWNDSDVVTMDLGGPEIDDLTAMSDRIPHVDYQTGMTTLGTASYFESSTPETINFSQTFDLGTTAYDNIAFVVFTQCGPAFDIATGGNTWYFDNFSITRRGQAHTPEPDGVEVDSTVVSSVSWYSPEQDENGDLLDDPNIVAVTGYDVYWSETDPNYLTATPVSVNQPGTAYTPTGGIDYSKTYYWRVDTYVTWDSKEFTGTDSYSSVVKGFEWQFTTLPEFQMKMTFKNVITTMELLPAMLSATITGNGAPLNAPVFTLLTDDPEFPTGANAVLTDTTLDNENPTATLTTDISGTYKVKLDVSDGATALSSTADVVVYADACDAKKNSPGGWQANDYDFNEDCYVDLVDFAMFTAVWLDDASMKVQEEYD